MIKPEKHILVCASFRLSGTPQGVCSKKHSQDLLSYLENELADRGMDAVAVSATACLKLCDKGPVLVVYPDNSWYGNVDSEDAVDCILDAIEEGREAGEYLLS